jgi:membrane-associated phospholipid phosphatase
MIGDATFRPLVDRLHEQSQVVRIMAIEAQQMLWEGYVNPEASPVGISAFPSLHIAISVTCACLGFAFSRVIGVVLTVFAAGIFVGSVHLGWHYAVDGYAGAVVAWACWAFASWWVKRMAAGRA